MHFWGMSTFSCYLVWQFLDLYLSFLVSVEERYDDGSWKMKVCRLFSGNKIMKLVNCFWETKKVLLVKKYYFVYLKRLLKKNYKSMFDNWKRSKLLWHALFMFLNFVFYKGFENKENCFLKGKNYYCSLNLTFYVFFKY